jgi:4-pyridoxolactonase
MSDTKVHLLDGGTLVIDGFHAFWNRGPGGEVRFPCYSVLIEHADGRYIFDTGYDFDHVMRVLPFEKPIQEKSQTHARATREAGLENRRHQLRHQLALSFRSLRRQQAFSAKACTLCHAKELEASGNCQPFEHLGYSDMSFAPNLAAKRGLKLPPDPAARYVHAEVRNGDGGSRDRQRPVVVRDAGPHRGSLQLDG